MKYIIFILVIAISFSGLQASLAQDLDFASTNTYQGTEITPENILKFDPQPPGDLKAKVEEFLTKNDILSNILSGDSYYQKIMYYPKAPFALDFSQQTADQDLKQLYFGNMANVLKNRYGITKSLGANFVLPFGDDWVIKASGFSNRRENIGNQLDKSYGAGFTQSELEKFKADIGKTYQTISRRAYWLRAHEAKEKLKLDRICLPQEYLIHIPGRPNQIDDTNYVIVEEKIKDAKPITQTSLAVDPEVIQQLTQLIGYTALWDINSQNIIVSGDKACAIDLEQPNVYRPTNFFNKNVGLHRAFLKQGWKQLEDNIIKQYANEHKADVKDLVEEKKLIEESIQQTWK